MRAAFIHGMRDVRLDTANDPTPTDTDILLQVSTVGICGSDLHYYIEGRIGRDIIKEAYIPGHEISARVIDDRAEQFGLHKGQLVAVDPARPCGHCENCHAGHPNLCLHMVFFGGTPNPGGMSEYIVAPRSALFPIPEGISPDAVAMMEPLGVALHAVGLAKLKLLENIAILGAGPIGLCVLQVARLCGVDNIFVIDPLAYRCDEAVKMGADKASGKFLDVKEWTDGRGVDCVIECTNDGNSVGQAGEIVRRGGRVILGGIPDGGRYEIEPFDLRAAGTTIKFVRRMGHVYPRCIRLVEKGLVDMDAVVTHRVALDDIKKGFDIQAERIDGVYKTMVYPNGLNGA